MGLLDDIFGKQAINKLTDKLAQKEAEITSAQGKISELNASRFSIEVELEKFKTKVSGLELQITSLNKALDEKNLINRSLESEVQTLKQKLGEQKSEFEKSISLLEVSLFETKAEASAAFSKRDSYENELLQLRKFYADKQRFHQEREAKLASISENLESERQKFQQFAREIHAKEENWNRVIQPQLRKYEDYLVLEKREEELQLEKKKLEELKTALDFQQADMHKRRCTDEMLSARENDISQHQRDLDIIQADLDAKKLALDSQNKEQNQRNNELEKLCRELEVFRDRTNQLDAETEMLSKKQQKLASLEESIKAHHAQRLLDFRNQGSKLIKIESALTQREIELNSKEKEIKREEAQIHSIKEKNLVLRNEQKRLKTLIDALEQWKIETTTEMESLTKKYSHLQSFYRVSQEKLKALTINNQPSTIFSEKILAWILEDIDPETAEVENGWLGSTGHGPWRDQLLESVLVEQSFKFYELPDADLEHVIVGRQEWSKSHLLAQIEAREGMPLRIYSQEMFFAKLITGKDPFDTGDTELLDAFAESHPAIQFLMTLPEPWPTLTNEESEEIVEVDGQDFGVSESPLHILGYRVGATSSLSPSERRKILSLCFETKELEFSDDSDEDYISKWGRGGGAQRLYRIAIHIKSLADGRVGKDYRKPQARKDWINDLQWLKEKYFSKYQYRFSWPNN